MKPEVEILANERGIVRLFALDLPREQIKFLKTEDHALAQFLELDALNTDEIELFEVDDLEELGLAGYLREGLEIPEDQIAPLAAQLDAQSGFMLAIRSRAFNGQAARLPDRDNCRLIGAFQEPGTDWSAQNMTSESAKPFSAPRLSPREARDQARRIGFTAFTIGMLVILGLAMWIIL